MIDIDNYKKNKIKKLLKLHVRQEFLFRKNSEKHFFDPWVPLEYPLDNILSTRFNNEFFLPIDLVDNSLKIQFSTSQLINCPKYEKYLALSLNEILTKLLNRKFSPNLKQHFIYNNFSSEDDQLLEYYSQIYIELSQEEIQEEFTKVNKFIEKQNLKKYIIKIIYYDYNESRFWISIAKYWEDLLENYQNQPISFQDFLIDGYKNFFRDEPNPPKKKAQSIEYINSLIEGALQERNLYYDIIFRYQQLVCLEINPNYERYLEEQFINVSYNLLSKYKQIPIETIQETIKIYRAFKQVLNWLKTEKIKTIDNSEIPFSEKDILEQLQFHFKFLAIEEIRYLINVETKIKKDLIVTELKKAYKKDNDLEKFNPNLVTWIWKEYPDIKREQIEYETQKYKAKKQKQIDMTINRELDKLYINPLTKNLSLEEMVKILVPKYKDRSRAEIVKEVKKSKKEDINKKYLREEIRNVRAEIEEFLEDQNYKVSDDEVCDLSEDLAEKYKRLDSKIIYWHIINLMEEEALSHF